MNKMQIYNVISDWRSDAIKTIKNIVNSLFKKNNKCRTTNNIRRLNVHLLSKN